MSSKTNNKVTDYISSANPALQPVMDYLRESIHEVYPQIEENMKWSSPSFEINGKIVIVVMAFKNHVNFLFTNVESNFAEYANLDYFGEKSKMMGVKHLKSIEQLPAKELLIKAIAEAIELRK